MHNFWDGAGGVLLEPNLEGLGVIDSILKSDGSGRDLLIQKNTEDRLPNNQRKCRAPRRLCLSRRKIRI